MKFGALRDPDGVLVGFDARPAAVKTSLAYSLQRLGTDHVDVYRPARLDPDVPIEDTVGAINEMIDAGHVRHIGLSEVGADTIRRAHAVHPVGDLQIEYSLISRGLEGDILADLPRTRRRRHRLRCAVPRPDQRPLVGGSPGRPATSGHTARGSAVTTWIATWRLVERLREVASQLGVSVAQVAIAWVGAQGDDIVPLVGARRRERLAESLGARRCAAVRRAARRDRGGRAQGRGRR